MKTIEELAREERLAYYKKWRAKNKDKIKQHNANYWRKKAEQRQGESNTDDKAYPSKIE